jgi:hypothetical protein
MLTQSRLLTAPESGLSIVSVLISAFILSLVGVSFAQSLSGALKARKDGVNVLKGNLAATELLELFQSMSSNELKTMLSTHPVSGSTTPSNLYPLCAHVNLVDPTTGSLLNPDPLADLPDGLIQGEQANRFYQVHILNVVTHAFSTAKCNQDPATLTLGSDERFLVTVGVSWKLQGGARKRVVMSGLVQ